MHSHPPHAHPGAHSRFHLPFSIAELRHPEGRDRAHFEHWAASYDRSLLQPLLFRPTHQAVIAAAERVGARHATVLDVGCGTGQLLHRVAQAWPEARLIGVDAAEPMVEQAQAGHHAEGRFQFKLGQAEALPQDDASVDVAMSTISFHHWTDQSAGLREIGRVLVSGGHLVLADLRPPLMLRPVLSRFHARRSRARLFAAAGLEVVTQHRPLRLGGSVLITVGRKP